MIQNVVFLVLCSMKVFFVLFGGGLVFIFFGFVVVAFVFVFFPEHYLAKLFYAFPYGSFCHLKCFKNINELQLYSNAG